MDKLLVRDWLLILTSLVVKFSIPTLFSCYPPVFGRGFLLTFISSNFYVILLHLSSEINLFEKSPVILEIARLMKTILIELLSPFSE